MAKVPMDGIDLEYDEKLSLQVFDNWEFSNREGYDFSNKVVYASSFSQERVDSVIFSETTENVTFIKCNLNNVVLPKNSTVIECSQKRFECQNDLNDWEIDEDGNPVAPMIGTKIFVKQGLPVPDPADIPVEEVDKAIDLMAVAIAKKESEN